MSISNRFIVLLLTLSLSVFHCSKDEDARQEATGLPSLSEQRALEQIQWFGFEDGLAKAITDNKPLFVQFYTDWCAACKMFQKETLENSNVERMLAKNFIAVRLNAENSEKRNKYMGKSLSNVELTSYFGIMAFPSLVFLEPGGRPITLIPGFVPAPQFLALLNYIQQKCYLTEISFHDFVMKGKCISY